ncbi:hypothetical protein RRG08_048147 [Elysia crispata]|uniref:Uncharacterized protein n=1 Tax=Elysia crispata TaxID=231223 RepID=A0AAE1DGQ7_9GAST|nr:hypothetical protein RRG08_048147 [Elysia crispata]
MCIPVHEQSPLFSQHVHSVSKHILMTEVLAIRHPVQCSLQPDPEMRIGWPIIEDRANSCGTSLCSLGLLQQECDLQWSRRGWGCSHNLGTQERRVLGLLEDTARGGLAEEGSKFTV